MNSIQRLVTFSLYNRLQLYTNRLQFCRHYYKVVVILVAIVVAVVAVVVNIIIIINTSNFVNNDE
jgi:hypothetical protein